MIPPVNRIAALRNEMLLDDLDEERRISSDLRCQVRFMEEKVRNQPNVEWLKQDLENTREECNRLREECNRLREDLRGFQHAGPVVKVNLFAYLTRQGKTTWGNNGKIQCIKEVRNITGWGLKETKDFCEALVWFNITEVQRGVTMGAINAACELAKTPLVYSQEDMSGEPPTPAPSIGELIKAKLSEKPQTVNAG